MKTTDNKIINMFLAEGYFIEEIIDMLDDEEFLLMEDINKNDACIALKEAKSLIS